MLHNVGGSMKHRQVILFVLTLSDLLNSSNINAAEVDWYVGESLYGEENANF